MKATRGNVHNHLGMIFRFKDSKVEVDMVECVKNMLKEFLVNFREIVENMTPAGVDPFNGDTSKKLNEEMRTMFHQTVAQGPFMCKQAWPNA